MKLTIASLAVLAVAHTLPTDPLARQASNHGSGLLLQKEPQQLMVMEPQPNTIETPKPNATESPKQNAPEAAQPNPAPPQPNAPAVPQPNTPEAPKQNAPEAPQPNPAVPQPNVPEAPKLNTPEAPQSNAPAAPEASKPNTPAAPQPNAPEAPKPNAPEAPKPNAPEAPKPNTPEAPQPNAPAVPQPNTPAAPQPNAPEAPQPNAPAAPEAAKPNAPAAPEALKPNAPAAPEAPRPNVLDSPKSNPSESIESKLAELQNSDPRYEASPGAHKGSAIANFFRGISRQVATRINDLLSPANVPLFLKKVVDSQKLQDSITEDALRERAEKLYAIARDSTKEYGHPTRVIGSKGHWGTVNYILGELHKLSNYYHYDVQQFDALDGKVKSFSLLIDGVEPKSVSALSLTPPTPKKKPVHGKLVLVGDNGCDEMDYPKSFIAGDIALVKRGVCPFSEKSIVAGRIKASGLIIYDEDAPLHGTLGEPTGKEVPTVAISRVDAQPYIDALTKNPDQKIPTTLYVDSYVKKIQTINVVAETKGGDHNNVVSLGAHSDSVSEGPGINDDGSGTISLLEVAKQLSSFKVNNAVRFAWWAAEEEGLLGSYAYANNLSPSENQKLRLFMDYDMMASPNYEYQVYDANNQDHPNGSGDLKNLYVKWYQANNLNYTFVPFDGRSDYVGFIDAGIPAGGIATGAEGVKSEEGVAKFGGQAGKWFDPCYHQLCDDLQNPDYTAWLTNTKLIAHSVATYGKSLEGFPQREFASTSEESRHKYSDSFKYRGSHLVV